CGEEIDSIFRLISVPPFSAPCNTCAPTGRRLRECDDGTAKVLMNRQEKQPHLNVCWSHGYNLSTGKEGIAGKCVRFCVQPAILEWRRQHGGAQEKISEEADRVGYLERSVAVHVCCLGAGGRRPSCKQIAQIIDRIAQIDVTVCVGIASPEERLSLASTS